MRKLLFSILLVVLALMTLSQSAVAMGPIDIREIGGPLYDVPWGQPLSAYQRTHLGITINSMARNNNAVADSHVCFSERFAYDILGYGYYYLEIMWNRFSTDYGEQSRSSTILRR